MEEERKPEKTIKISDCMERIKLARSTIIEHIKKGNIKAEMRHGETGDEWHIYEESFSMFAEEYKKKTDGKTKHGQIKEQFDHSIIDKPYATPNSGSLESQDTRYTDLLKDRLQAAVDERNNKDKEIEYLKRQLDQQTEYLKRQIEEERTDKRNAVQEYQESHRRELMLMSKLKSQEQTIVELEAMAKQAIEYKKQDAALNDRLVSIVEESKRTVKEEIAQGKITVLAIDDDFDFLNILKTNFTNDNNIALYTANNAIDANRYIVRGIWDIVLLDLRLQENDLTGEEYYKKIKNMSENLAGTKLIIISGESDSRIQEAKEELNAVAVMKKPVRIAELIQKIKDISNETL